MTIEKNGVSEYPEILNKDFFKRALENGFKVSNIQVEDLKIAKIGGDGGNYTSEIYRVLVLYRNAESPLTQEISLIVKNVEFRDIELEMLLFNKEVFMYEKIIPEIEDIVKDISFSPKFFYYVKGTHQIVVFQDINALGYKLADREKGLDEEHARIALKKIAKLHAGSMILAKKDPESMKPFHRGMFSDKSKDSKIHKAIFLDNLTHMISVVENWPHFEDITRKLKNIEANYYDICCKFIKPKPTDINVLNHGDLWVNNFMYKYENGKPTDISFFDLQVSFYSTLGIDIHYFLNTSVQLDVLMTKRYELLLDYYKSFRETLEKVNYPSIPTWQDIKNEIKDKEFYGFISFQSVLPFVSTKPSADSNFETLEDEERSRKKRDIMFSTKRMRSTMEYLLNRFDELGVLDIGL